MKKVKEWLDTTKQQFTIVSSVKKNGLKTLKIESVLRIKDSQLFYLGYNQTIGVVIEKFHLDLVHVTCGDLGKSSWTAEIDSLTLLKKGINISMSLSDLQQQYLDWNVKKVSSRLYDANFNFQPSTQQINISL